MNNNTHNNTIIIHELTRDDVRLTYWSSGTGLDFRPVRRCGSK